MANNEQLFPNVKTAPTFENIISTLQTPTGKSRESAIPEIEAILGQASQFLQPQIEGIQRGTQSNLADLSGFFAKRGATGSSFEGFAAADVLGKGQQAEAGVRGQFALNTALPFAQLVLRAREGDAAALEAVREMLAQAMGEELTAQRDIKAFGEERDFLQKRQREQAIYDLVGSVIGQGSKAGFGKLFS